MAKESGIEGIFILISKKEKKIQVLGVAALSGRNDEAAARRDPNGLHRRVSPRRTSTRGLKLGVAAIGESLVRAQRAGELSGKPADRGAWSGRRRAGSSAVHSLVLRNQVRLTLPGARVLIAAAQEKAER